MKNEYEILKDPIYKMWVVWEVHRNVKFEMFKAKTKRECKQWLKENIND